MPSPLSTTRAARRSDAGPNASYAQALLRELLATSLVLADDWEQLDPVKRAAVTASREEEELLQRLVECGLLNSRYVVWAEDDQNSNTEPGQ